MQSATLNFDMSAVLNKRRGTQPAAAPYFVFDGEVNCLSLRAKRGNPSSTRG